MNEKEQAKILLKSVARDIEKKKKTISDHEYKISVYTASIGFTERELKIRTEMFDEQIKNFKFSEHYKPNEEWLETEAAENYSRDLQKIVCDQKLFELKDFIRTQKVLIDITMDDLVSLKSSLKIQEVEYAEKVALIEDM